MLTTGYILADKIGLPIINMSWASQASWYIDPISGDDQNAGIDSAHAIKTWGELRRRMIAVGGHITPDTYIYILSSLPDNDPCIPDWDCLGNMPVRVRGVPTVARTGEMTAGLITRDPSTNQSNVLTDSGVADWTPEIGFNSGKILRMSSGDALDQHAWILKNLGNHQARLSAFYDVAIGDEVFSDDGENYEILSLPFIRNYCITPKSGFFFFKYLNFGDENSTQYLIAPNTSTQGCQFTYCAVYNIDTSNCTVYFVNSCLKTPLRFYNGFFQMAAGCMGNMINSPFAFSDGEIESAGVLYLTNGACFQGIRENTINNGITRSVDAMVFDSPDNGWAIGTSGVLRITKLSGLGNAQHGLYISPSGTVFADLSQCTIIGTTNDVYFAGTEYSWSTIQGLGYVKSSTSYASIGSV